MKVKHNETLLDIAVVQAGNVAGIFDMALLNNISLTKEMISGEELITGAVISQETVDDLKSRNARPAKSIRPGQGQLEGIDYWKIYVDFIVQ